jgi:glucose/arabinose dehydrogenase
MKYHLFTPLCLVCLSLPAFAADDPKPIVSGMKNPESACLGKDGRIYVTEIGENGKDGDGQLTVIDDGHAKPFATGLDDPKGVVFFQNAFYLTDKTRVVKVDERGRATTLVEPDKFPTKPQFLNDIAVDAESGTLFVSDSGDLKGAGGAVFSIHLKSGKTALVVDAKSLPGLNTPNGLALDGGGPMGGGPMFGGAASHLLLADFGSGVLYRIKLADKSVQKTADGFDGADALTWDHHGRLFITSWKTGKVWGIPRPGQKAVLLSDKFQHAADCCLDATGRFLLVPDMEAGTLTALPTTIAGWEVDDSPLEIEAEVAFPQLEFTGWGADSDDGRVRELRLTLLTHAGDGSNRVFALVQEGQIHVFPNDDKAEKTSIFLDIRDRVRYSDKQNEEGLLGLAFHPKFKTNGEFFVFYTDVKAKMANVVSRFRVRKDDPNRADPASEEEIIRFEKPYWNHDGGTILFGPDGFLYVTHGDGGLANDPYENGQNLKTLLGKVLRLDVDGKANGKKYAIPKDNPFVGKSNAAPEIWAYGLRNVWRMAFDRKTGVLWAGDVGQNLYEEIDLLKAGGNYGWNLRESLHPFGKKGVGVRDDLIDPIWEYHHDIGKSITGGVVYRGVKLPELDGAYLYADYVTMRLWALWYDPSKGRVVANREIKGPARPVLSFGEDEQGEAYFLALTADGRSIYRFAKQAKDN